MDGIININKPSGMTSSDVVVALKRKLKTRTVGHMGTLDPIGTGVLVIGVGLGARLFNHFLKKDKTYIAEFEFGFETDTLDNTGVVTKTTDIYPTQQQINANLANVCGKLKQVPPAYSAKSINGVRAYDLARQGIAVELKAVDVTVHDIKCLECTGPNKFLFEISCSSGTYIRSICRDLAYSVNSYGTMNSICRTRSGKFLLEDAIELDNVDENCLHAVDEMIELPKYVLGDEHYKLLCNGVKINAADTPAGEFLLYCNGEFFGIANNESGIKVITYLRRAK